MEKEIRQRLERLTQQARRLLEQEFQEQLEGRYDILLDGRIPLAPGAHLSARERVVWDKLVAAVAHKRSQGITAAAAVAAYLREAAFHTLNRFVALKMLEARNLVHECISRGEDSTGFREFIALAPGLVALPDKGYRLYVETIFDEIAQEVRALFDRRDAATLLWPRRQALTELLGALNDAEVASVWGEDETIGWVYQYFNGEDERRQMRAESQAPRNSRELAVRNQFFTPRYVVQFLTDNSLGRTWSEMRGGDTQLAHLDYLVKPEEGFEQRTPKDPRDIRVLDPACGSGHFLLYAFDLLAGDPRSGFLGIYEEAWRAEATPKSEVTGRTLKEDYDSRLALRRAVPELVLKHNLYGVDIDPRAAQIAGLALWMRAQRAYNDYKVAAQDRPLISRTNIVTAEPMPGDRSMVAEFASTLRPQVLGELFQQMVEEMRLAGELGTLLRIDRSLQSAVSKARQQYVREQREPQRLFPGLERPRNPLLEFNLSGVSEESFFDSAEEYIVEALQDYAAGAPAGMSMRRQLFAHDAAQGVAFIDLSRKRFDVVLMNPPFGDPSLGSARYIENHYAGPSNLVVPFLYRASELVCHAGFAGAVVDRTVLIKNSYEEVRRGLLLDASPVRDVVDLGWDVLDANVEISILVAQQSARVVSGASLTAELDKASALQRWCKEPTRFGLDAFRQAPFSVINCQLPDYLLRALGHWGSIGTHVPGFVNGHTIKSDELKRLVWELRPSDYGEMWQRMWNGSRYSPYYVPFTEAVITGIGKHRLDSHPTTIYRSTQSHGQPGICYGKRGDYLCAQILPPGHVLTNEGFAAVLEDCDWTWFLLGVMNSLVVQHAINQYCGQHKGVGYVNAMPVPARADAASEVSAIAMLARGVWRILSSVAATDETDSRFVSPWSPSAPSSVEELAARASQLESRVQEKHGEIERAIARLYCTPEEQAAVEMLNRARPCPSLVRNGRGDAGTIAHDIFSWSLGVAFGRFDVRLAIGEREAPPQPEPFDPLPVCSPGMLTGDDGLPVAAPPSGYPLAFPTDGILVDDPGHPRDVVRAVRSVFEPIFDDPNARWHEAAELLGTPDLRTWFARDFFEPHIKRYSKSRRKAPIYWQLATASGSYSVWLYIHRATGDTLFRVLNDFVGPKLDHEKAKLDGLTQEAGAHPSAAQRREIEKQETFVGELQALRAEVARVAPLWKPNLDDGVILNFAPLWRLVPQNRSWLVECKKAWDKLVAGDYDWAHLAMHLWPERVVPKCIDDRSLAIAHGLEDVFWHEDDSGTWRKSRVDDATVQKLIQERTSATVKVALKDLLSAATPTASKGRGAKGRRASPRTSAPRTAPAAVRANAPDTSVDEATLRTVRSAIASVADGASKADVLAATGLPDGDWNKVIAALLDRGDVTRTGQKRGTRYHADSPGEGG